MLFAIYNKNSFQLKILMVLKYLAIEEVFAIIKNSSHEIKNIISLKIDKMLSRQFFFIQLFNFPAKIAMNNKKLTRYEKNEKLKSEALTSFIRNSITIVNDECLLIFLSASLYV